MILFLFSIAVSCLLIALAQGAVFLISLVTKSAHRAKSTSVRRSVQNFTGLPNREEVKNIYSLSDQFADRLREVVQLSAYRYTELDLRVRRAELTRLTARKEALILEGNTDLLFHLEHAICAAKDAIRVLCTRQAEIEAAIDTVESAALREILTQHYICALDLKEIAERMHYSDRHMRRLHRKAIESVSLSAVSPFKKRGSSPRTLPLVKRI